jgi:hypothetical protein
MYPRRVVITTLLAGSLALSPMMVGCEQLPGDEKTQGAVIGGLAGAGAGALIGGKEHRLLGALIGGAAGAGGGYLIGANWDKITGKDKDHSRDEAVKANERAQKNPADPKDVERAKTADLNDDGFVTLDEVVAMDKAGLSDREMIRRLERTQQYFELTEEQEQYLQDNGVSRDVVVALRTMNPEQPRQASDKVIGSERERSDR